MARDITTDEQTELAAEVNRPAFFFEGGFNSIGLRLWTGRGTKQWNGEDFLGNGWLYAVRTAAEVQDIRAAGITIELNGLPDTVISTILTESKYTSTGRLWLCMMSPTGSVVGNGYLLFSGKLEAPEIEETADGARVSIGYEGKLAALLRRREHRYNDQSQRLFYPADAGMQYVVQAQQWSGYWGRGENKLRLRRRDRR